MAFQPRSNNVRNGYVRNPNQTAFKQYQQDIVLDITKYEDNKIFGTNVRDGVTYQIEIADDTKKYLINNPDARKKGEDAAYNGRVINAALKSKIPVGSRIVAERFESAGAPRKEGDNIIRHGTIYQLWRSPAPQKEKAFPGIFSASEFDRQLVSVNGWGEKGYNITNEKMLNAFAKRLDSIHEDFKKSALFNASKSEDDHAKYSTLIKQGFQMRAGYYTKLKNERTGADETVLMAFNKSPAVDTQSKPMEGLSFPLPVTGKDFLEYVEDYKNYIEGTATLPAGVDRKDVVVQFTTYKIYRITSQGSNAKAFQIRDYGSGEYSHQGAALLNRKTYLSLEEDEQPEVHGHNFAVLGALILSSDAEDSITGEKVPRNLVGHFFARGVRAVTTSLIGSDYEGEFVRTHLVERLQEVKDESRQSATPATRQHATTSAASKAPPVDHAPEPDMSAPATPVIDVAEVEDDDIPF